VDTLNQKNLKNPFKTMVCNQLQDMCGYWNTPLDFSTNQGVVGSIPASRTKREALEQKCSRAFSFLLHAISLDP
jgi:hypothetical protein